ncbi:hypothetical protein G6F50_014464 [Rhizopus delemar]|uniref:Uncharacterized protein n=1 Tax=Rhizopus delemar TaxID=936053 RepID=A0A9P6Y548_9FUNG|nr:hypothetical protein G6F50_014464 [Rhizopus delemar]
MATDAQPRRYLQPGTTQQARGHVLVHRHRRAQHRRTPEGQVGHAQQALQRTVLAQRPMHDRQHHVDLAQHAGRIGRLQLQLRLLRAGKDRQRLPGTMQRDARRVIGMEQEGVRLAQMPLALLVDADQHRLEALAVEGIEDVLRRLQRNFVLGGPAPEDDADPGPCHGVAMSCALRGHTA